MVAEKLNGVVLLDYNTILIIFRIGHRCSGSFSLSIMNENKCDSNWTWRIA